jgi:hypothetical protein
MARNASADVSMSLTAAQPHRDHRTRRTVPPAGGRNDPCGRMALNARERLQAIGTVTSAGT